MNGVIPAAPLSSGQTWTRFAAPGIVVVTWLFLSLSALLFTKEHAVNLPYWDEWEEVEVAVGERPLTLEALWSQHNDSRVVLRKLAEFALVRVGRGDFRVINYGVVALLSALSLTVILMLRRVRGQIAVTDAVVPLLLLQRSMYINFIWADPGFVWGFVTGGALIATVMAANGRYRTPFAAVTIFAASLSATLGCVGGLPIATAIAIWLLGTGCFAWRKESTSRQQAILLCALGIAALIPIGCYFIDYRRETPRVDPTLAEFLRGIVEFAACPLRPESAPSWPIVGAIVIALFVSNVGLSITRLIRSANDRPATTASVIFPLAFAGLWLIAAWQRGGYCPGACTAERYTLVAACLILVPYLSIATWRDSRASALAWAWLVLCGSMVVPNWAYGSAMAEIRFAVLRDAISNIKHALPTPDELTIRGRGGIGPHPRRVSQKLQSIAAVRFGPFSGVSQRQLDWFLMSPEARFDWAGRGKLLASLNLAEFRPTAVVYMNDAVAAASDANDAIVFEATGEDPGLELMTIPCSRFLAIDVTVPEDTFLQVYLRSLDGDYSEANSLGAFVTAGRNRLALALPARPYPVALRLDPGSVVGEYRIHSVELRERVKDPPTSR